jgi:serine/threonine-protein kinase
MIGMVLGSYRLVRELSSGGMGTVYRAEHELLGRVAAVKLLRPELSQNQELVYRFFNEAKAATAIRHPGIVEVFDFGYSETGTAYLVMELLEGESLAARIAKGPLSESHAAQIARGIASALSAAHAKGIVHRDLKPDNVFLVPDPDVPMGERPKVLDFGVAKLGDQLPKEMRHTVTGALMGTPLYMAPEQARAAGAIDHRADLYSLGCILYEMLVGTPPFQAQGAGEIIALQLFAQPEAPSKRATVAADLEAIVMRLLEKEPEARFQSAAETSEALGRVLQRLDVRVSMPLAATEPRATAGHAKPLPVPTVVQPPATSKLPIIAGAITVALAAAVVFVIAHAKHPGKPVTPPPAPVVAQPPPIVDPPKPPPPQETVEQLPVPESPPPKQKQKAAKGPTTQNGSPYFDKL